MERNFPEDFDIQDYQKVYSMAYLSKRETIVTVLQLSGTVVPMANPTLSGQKDLLLRS